MHNILIRILILELHVLAILREVRTIPFWSGPDIHGHKLHFILQSLQNDGDEN